MNQNPKPNDMNQRRENWFPQNISRKQKVAESF